MPTRILPKDKPSYYTEEQVLEMRRSYRTGAITQHQLVERYGGTQRTVASAIVGRTFSRVPEAIKPFDVLRAKRKLTPEQALFVRLQYAGMPSLGVERLGEVYGVHMDSIRKILKGQMYPDVPGAPVAMRPMGRPRKLTDEQVIAVRRRYRTRYVSIPSLATEYGMGVYAMTCIIRGYAYKELPLAVPGHVRMIRRGVKVLPSAKTLQRRREATQTGVEPANVERARTERARTERARIEQISTIEA